MNALMIGTGEYTTGYVHGAASPSDKSAGVVALTLFNLRRRRLIENLKMAGSNGTRFPGIRQHLKQKIGDVYADMDVQFDSFPADTVESRPDAYLQALDTLSPGDVVTIFTPDDTHFQMAMDAVARRCHVLVAKPIVKLLAEHLALAEAASEQGVLVCMEVHKRFDPIYADARDQIRKLGDFGFFSSYMSQPKSQLDTFASWAGQSSDISYYLNAHHVDFNVWAVSEFARPVSVHALGGTGVARAKGINTEDTITLCVQWQNIQSANPASAVYTASWIAPPSDVHSQQRFFYLGHSGQVQVDQAHRGYTIATDQTGHRSANPFFMKYAPDANGCFAGQLGYGYRSIELFVEAAAQINSGQATASAFADRLATVQETAMVTAILEAGRRSLDQGGRVVRLDYDANGQVAGITGA